MECVLAKNGRNSSLHNGLKGYLEIATGDPKLVDNLALKGWLRGQSESLKAEYPNMPTDENNEAIVFYHNESVRSDSNNLTLDVAAVADKIDQWKPVFLKDSDSIVQANNPYFLGYVPNDSTIPVFEESTQKLIVQKLPTVSIKPGVEELFESDSDLANQVYEALGFEIPTTKLQGKQFEYGEPRFFDVVEELTSGERASLPSSILINKLLKGEYLPEIKESQIILGLSEAGIWRPNIKKIEASGENKSTLAKKIGHELLHSVTSNIILSYQNLKGTVDFTDKYYKDFIRQGYIKPVDLSKSQIEALDNLVRIRNKVISYVEQNKDKIQKQDRGFGTYDYFIRTNYTESETDLHEFISEVFTNPELINILKEIPTEGKKSKLFKDFVDAIAKILGFTNTSILEDIIAYSEEAFFTQPQITPQQKQQAQQLYSQYLDTIFPDSKIKDIVYHGTKSNEVRTVFDKETIQKTGVSLGKGFFFSRRKDYVERDVYGFKKIGSYLLNITNPINGKPDKFLIETDFDRVPNKNKSEIKDDYLDDNGERIYTTHRDVNFESDEERTKVLQQLGYDAVDFHKGEYSNEIVVFESEQIHILGSKQDIEGFKTFVNTQPSQPMYSRSNTGTATDEAALLTFARFLANKTGINFRLVTADEALRLNPNYNGEPGFFHNNMAYLVKGVANKSTALHEIFGHPIVELLEQQKPELLQKLYATIPQAVIAEIKALYPENILEDGSLDAIGMKEALIKAIEYEAKNRLEGFDSSFKAFVDQLWLMVKRFFRGVFGVDSVGRYTTIKELADLAFNTSVLDSPIASNQLMYFKTASQSQLVQQFESAFNKYTQVVDTDGIEVYKNTQDPSLLLKRLTEETSRIFSNEVFGKTIDQWANEKATSYFQSSKSVFKDTDKSIASGSIEIEKGKYYSFSELVDHFIRERNTNMRKGKLMHAMMEFILTLDITEKRRVRDQILKMQDPEIVNGKIVADGLDISMYEYIKNTPDGQSDDAFEVLKYVSDVLRIRLNDPLVPDILKNEYIMGNDELGIATRADTIVFHHDGTASVFDYQGGNLHSDESFAQVAMKYFTQNGQKKNVVSKVSMKQMEITMRMLIMKRAVPNLKFRRAEVFEIRRLDDGYIRPVDGSYDLQEYLYAIENWIKEEYPHLYETYKKEGLFSRDEYMAPGLHAHEFLQEATKVIGVDANTAAEKLAESLVAVSAGIQYLEQNQKGSPAIKVLQDQQKDLIKQWGDLQRTNKLNVNIWNQLDDMGGSVLELFNTRWDLSKYPILQVIIDAESKAVNKALRRADDVRAEHNALMEDVINDYQSIDPLIRSKIRIGTGNIKLFDFPIYKGDGTGFFDFAYVKKNLNGRVKLGWVSEEDTQEWSNLTPAQKAYMNFINSEMRIAYKTSVQDTMIKTLRRKGDSYEEDLRSKADLIGTPSLEDNFMPYVPPMQEELSNKSKWGFLGSMKKWTLLSLTEALNGKSAEHPGMPVRFLHASEEIIESELHSLHVEHMFNTFVNQLYLVEELEEVHAAAKGLSQYLRDFGIDQNGDYVLENIEQTLRDFTKMHITGRTKAGKDTLKVGTILGQDNTLLAINLDSAMAGLKTFTTYSSMLLSPVLATANLSTIALLNFKTAGVNSVTKALQKQLGIKDDRSIDFEMSDIIGAHKEYLEIQRIIMSGGGDNELNRNKMWKMMKEWRIFPDDYWFANSRNKDNVVKSTNLLTPESGMFLHLLGENYGVITSFAAMVKKMEVQKGKQRKTIYDSYDIKEVDTKSGKKIPKLVWNFGMRGVEIVKGTENDDIKTTTPITELTSREIDYFKRAISKIHGDYRKSEKAMGEKYALFQWTAQFKKYLMRQIKNLLEEKRLDSALGQYDQVMGKDGKPILIKVKDENGVETEESYIEWTARVTEGRYRTVANFIIQWLHITKSPLLSAYLTRNNIKIPAMEQWTWENLSDDQKKNMVHVAFDLIGTFALLLLKEALIPDDDQNNKNPWYVQYVRLMENYSEGANPYDSLRAAHNPVPAIGRLYNIATYGSEFLFSVATGDRTQNGDLRGINSLLNNLPLSNAMRQIERFR